MMDYGWPSTRFYGISIADNIPPAQNIQSRYKPFNLLKPPVVCLVALTPFEYWVSIFHNPFKDYFCIINGLVSFHHVKSDLGMNDKRLAEV